MNKKFHTTAIELASSLDLFNTSKPPDIQIKEFADELLSNIFPAHCPHELINTMLKALLECSNSDLEDLSPSMYKAYKDGVLRVYEALISNYYKKD